MCGDSTRPEYVSRLMGDERAILFATDTPYAVNYAGGSHPATRANRAKANRDKDWSKVYHGAGRTTFDNEDGGGDLPVTLAENQISVTLVPFLSRFEIDAAFHADASLLAVEHWL